DAVLAGARRLAGKVVDEQERAVAGATVLFGSFMTDTRGPLPAATSDANGEFAVDSVDPLVATIEARADGYAGSGRVPCFLGMTNADPGWRATIVLPRACGSVTGTVRRPDGAPLERAAVWIEPYAKMNRASMSPSGALLHAPSERLLLTDATG